LTVNGWVENTKATVLSVVDRVTIKNTRHIGVCLCHNYPSLHWETYQDEIISLTERIVSAFQIKDGPIYFQYLVGRRD
jgi:DNA repair protein RadC